MLQVSNVSKRFFTQPVLNRISFDVERGQSLVILGQSGVGKSVLLKILAQLVVPDEGSVQIESRNLGMLFQKNALFDSLTVEENLEFPLRERTELDRRLRLERIRKFLDWVGLSESRSLYPDELSGGMQKRLGIARALIVEPEVLFYDEPTAGLDPITSRIIADLILRLKKEFGTTIIVVTSDVMRAYQLADQIGILMKSPEGAVFVRAGSPEQARNSEDPAIQQFLQGLTKGPLTSAMEQELIMNLQAPESPACFVERLDVDFF
ncbi:MAG: ATP-binding cassette domain-containing protein [Bdellovibrionota bacterium]